MSVEKKGQSNLRAIPSSDHHIQSIKAAPYRNVLLFFLGQKSQQRMGFCIAKLGPQLWPFWASLPCKGLQGTRVCIRRIIRLLHLTQKMWSSKMFTTTHSSLHNLWWRFARCNVHQCGVQSVLTWCSLEERCKLERKCSGDKSDLAPCATWATGGNFVFGQKCPLLLPPKQHSQETSIKESSSLVPSHNRT